MKAKFETITSKLTSKEVVIQFQVVQDCQMPSTYVLTNKGRLFRHFQKAGEDPRWIELKIPKGDD